MESKMLKNVGRADRLVRLGLGIGLIVIGLGAVGGTAGLVVAGLAAIPLFTAAVGWCPLYSLFGVGTCAVDRHAGGGAR
jgi:hypothetical protein